MAHPFFNAAYYLHNNPDVAAAGYTVATAENHYLQYGAHEAYRYSADLGDARKPAPWFDVAYYLDTHPDLQENGVTPASALHHFATHGMAEGRSPSPHIALNTDNLGAYAAGNADLMTAFGISNPAKLTHVQTTALAQHYYQYGYQEDRPDLPVVNGFFTYNDPDGAARDYLIGTAYNDTFVADIENSLQTDDFLDGGGGYNMLYIADGALPLATDVRDPESVNHGSVPVIRNVQKISNADVRVRDADLATKALNLKNVTGLQLLETDFSTIANDKEGFLAGYAVTQYVEAAATTVFSLANAPTQPEPLGPAGFIVKYAQGQPDDTLNLRLQNNAEGSYYLAVIAHGDQTDGPQTVNIDVHATNRGTLELGTGVQHITIAGSGQFALQNRSYSDLVTLDASAATGRIAVGGPDRNASPLSLDAELKLGDDFVMTTGTGDDIVDLSTVTTTGYVHTGAGNDTLIIDFSYTPPVFPGLPSLPEAPEAAVLWTLSGGAGHDVFQLRGFNVYEDDAGFATGLNVVITDFDGSGDSLALNVGADAPTVFVDETVIERVLANAHDINDALNTLLGAEHDNAFTDGANVAVFELGGTTYAVYEVGEHGHGLVELSGTSLGLSTDNVTGF